MAETTSSIGTIRVAAVQMQSRLGCIEDNLQHATRFVEQAASQGARLIVLPELAAAGYTMSRSIWKAGETSDGRTVNWLRDVCRRLRAYVGIGFVEAAGEEFFNSYALGDPDGQIAGRVRKTMAETYCFRCAHGPHVIDTEIGRIGVGICADNHFVPVVRQMQRQAVDLILMPHALPGAFKTGGSVSQSDIERARQKARAMAPLCAHLLGVPAIFANATGPRGDEKWAGILGSLMSTDAFQFLGLSTIANSDGTIAAALDGAEDILVVDVVLDPAKKASIQPERYGWYGGGWVQPTASPLVDVICQIDASVGKLLYDSSRERRASARAVATRVSTQQNVRETRSWMP